MNPTIGNLISAASDIVKKYDNAAMQSGENFNLFSIMRAETDEVRTHSRFLAALLNPKGSHGKKTLFLESFIKLFGNDSGLDPKTSKVYVEYYLGKVEKDQGGRIDIFIRDNSGRVMMIENKINAKEAHKQILRYHNEFPHGTLLFLTLFGNESDDKEAKDKYHAISYEHNIISWLNECLKEAFDAPTLRENIKQYINLLKKLTYQNTNESMNTAILEKFTKDADSYKAFTTLVNSRNAVLPNTLKDVVMKVLRQIAEDFNLTLLIPNREFTTAGVQYLGFSFRKKSVETGLPHVTFQFQATNYCNLIFGLTEIDAKSLGVKESENITAQFKERFGRVKRSDAWFAFTNYDNYYNWSDLNTLGQIRFGDFESDIRDKVRCMLEIIDSNWNVAQPEPVLQAVT